MESVTQALTLSGPETAVLQRELREAQETLTAALRAETPLSTLVDLTAALETLTATQHELVNVLLDRGATWSQVADALASSSAAARRRFPRRDSRHPAEDEADVRAL